MMSQGLPDSWEETSDEINTNTEPSAPMEHLANFWILFGSFQCILYKGGQHCLPTDKHTLSNGSCFTLVQ